MNLQTKVSLQVMLVTLLGIGGLAYIEYSYQAENNDQIEADFHQILAENTSKSIASAIWNYDEEASEAAVLGLFKSQAIKRVFVFDENGGLFAGREVGETAEEGYKTLEESEATEQMGTAVKEAEEDFIKSSLSDVMRQISLRISYTDDSDEQKVVGYLVAEYSIQKGIERTQETLQRIAVFGGISAFLTVLLLTLSIFRSVVSPINRLSAASKVIAEGDFDQELVSSSKDEIGQLTRSFNDMRLKVKDFTLNLQQLIDERTAQIRVILDHVHSGFFLVDQNFRVQSGFTKSCVELLEEEQPEGKTISGLLKIDSKRESENFEVLLEQLFEDLGLDDLLVDQIPNRFHIGSRTVSAVPSTVRDEEGEISRLLFSITDITDLQKAEQETEHQRNLLKILQRKTAFKKYLKNANQAIEECYYDIENDNMGSLRAKLHTLKGNSMSYGLVDLGNLVHDVEGLEKITKLEIDNIDKCLSKFLEDNYSILKMANGEVQVEVIEIPASSLEHILRQLEDLSLDVNQKKAISEAIYDLTRKPVSNYFANDFDYVERLAERFDKKVELVIKNENIRIGRDEIEPFLEVFGHFVRNSIHHGIEKGSARGKKDPTGKIELTFGRKNGGIEIDLEDDGAGIDTDVILEKAVKSGLLTSDEAKQMPQQQALELIFESGLSSMESVTDISGRGVGMDAIRKSISACNGTISVTSKKGKGTKFHIMIPGPAEPSVVKVA